MLLKRSWILSIAMLSVSMTLTACDGDKNFKPGAPEPASQFSVFGTLSPTKFCVALDATVAVHRSDGSYKNTLTPVQNGKFDLASVSPTDYVTLVYENSSSVSVISIKAVMIPEELSWSLTNYEGQTGECFSIAETPTSEAIITNTNEFASVKLGPTDKVSASSEDLAGQWTVMRDQPYQLLASGYDASEDLRLTDYGLAGISPDTPADGLKVEIDTPATPLSVIVPGTMRGLWTTWLPEDIKAGYDLESLSRRTAADTSVSDLNILYTVEPGKGYFLVNHIHSSSLLGLSSPVTIRDRFTNTGAIELTWPNLSALTSINYSEGKITYNFADALREREQIQSVTLSRSSENFGDPARFGRSGAFGIGDLPESENVTEITEGKAIGHTVYTDSAEGFHTFPDIDLLISSPLESYTLAGVRIRVTEGDWSEFDYEFSVGGILGVAPIPEEAHQQASYPLSGQEFRTHSLKWSPPRTL